MLLPPRERLGVELLAAGRPDQAGKAFRADLDRNVGNPRSLHGVWRSLEAQKIGDVNGARKAFEEAWVAADVTLGPDLLGTPR